jgi:enoyl-CoA hydratase
MPGYAVLRLHEVVGRTRAKELILTGRQFDAAEAEKIGIVNQIVPHDDLMDTVKKKATLLMERAPMSLTLSKMTVNRSIGGDDLNAAINATSLLFGFEDIKEGQRSFFEKRKPNFKGK